MKIIVDKKKRIADMVKNCREAREEEENVKILVERKTIQKAVDLLIASDIDCDPALRIEAECLLRRILDTNTIGEPKDINLPIDDDLLQAIQESMSMADGKIQFYPGNMEYNNRNAIIEILDILIRDEKRKTIGLGSGISTLLQSDTEALKAKMVGEK